MHSEKKSCSLVIRNPASCAASSGNYPKIQGVRLREDRDNRIYKSAHTSYIKNIIQNVLIGTSLAVERTTSLLHSDR